MQGKGVISENDLMMKLVNAKKVMNKVDKGDYQTGNINESILLESPEVLMGNVTQENVNVKPINKNVSIEKIQNSKLPQAIKQAMIDNPIPQISLNETLDMDFIKGAKRLMEREGLVESKNTTKQQQIVQNQNIDMNAISVIIENVVRKVMDEKLNQILTAQQTSTINENLVLKVGDSIFKGKITGVNKAK